MYESHEPSLINMDVSFMPFLRNSNHLFVYIWLSEMSSRWDSSLSFEHDQAI